jgi:hypothetical protein
MKSITSFFALCAALCSHSGEAAEASSTQILMRKKEPTAGDSSSMQIKAHIMPEGASTEPTLEAKEDYLTEALEDQTNAVKTELPKTNIYFTGKRRKNEQVGNTEKLLRPDLVKFMRCKGSDCSDCPSQSDCGWEGDGSTGAGGRFELKYPRNANRASCSDFDAHVAEYWVDCSDGQGKWTVSKNVNGAGVNDDMKVYLVEDGGILAGTEVPQVGNGWTIHAADGPSRIRVVIKPTDCSQQVKAFVKVRGFNVKQSAAMCMDSKMCLRELDQDNEADSNLRNSNQAQLQCLTGASTSDSCQRWKNCLNQNQVDEATLLAILQASLPQSPGSLAELEPASKTSTGDVVTGSCVHPANDDPESWECECGEILLTQCAASSEALKDCIHRNMCASADVCDAWKDNEGACSSMFIEANESDRPKPGTALDESLTDKRSC